MSNLVSLFQKLDYGPAPESDQPAQQWLESHNHSFGFYLNGNWEMPEDAELFSVENPATANNSQLVGKQVPEKLRRHCQEPRKHNPSGKN